MFGNRLLGRKFGAKRDEVKGDWRTLHKEELYDLYCLSNIIWVIKYSLMGWAEGVTRMGRLEVHTGFWWGNLKEQTPLGLRRIRRDNNIKMDLQEISWGHEFGLV
jgi:hypothetical protein